MKDSGQMFWVCREFWSWTLSFVANEQISVSNLNTAQGSDLDKGPYLRMSDSGEVAAEDLQPASFANTGNLACILWAQTDHSAHDQSHKYDYAGGIVQVLQSPC